MVERDSFYFRVFCITFWIMAVCNFVLDELLPFLPIGSFLLLLSDVVFLLLGLATLRKKSDIILIIIFGILGVTSSIINKIPTLLWVNGMRDYIAFLFPIPILRYFFTCKNSEEFRASFDRQLKIFLIIQVFCLLEQFIRYGAGDHGGGSLGNFFSGIISTCIIAISFYFVTKTWNDENYLQSLRNNQLYMFLMFPVLLNETKISFVYLLIYFVILMPFSLKSIGRLFIFFPVIVLALVGLFYVYNWLTYNNNMDYSEGFITDYLTGGENAEELLEVAETALDFVEDASDTWYENDWAYVDIPRILKFPLFASALEDSRGGWWFGAGAGHLKGGTTLKTTQFAEDHIPLIFGTRMQLHNILLPFGILGMIWVFFWYKCIFQFKKREGPNAMRVKLFMLSIVLLSFVYQEIFRYLVPAVILYYITLSTTYPIEREKPKIVDNSTDIQSPAVS